MGRSSGYCFKIIACGGSSESVDRDDLDASSENKGSDKRGWSFRKRSAGQRVLSNTIITEIPSSENKKISEPVINNSEAPVSSSESEKTSTNQWTEEFSRVSTSTTKESTISNLATKAADEDDIKFDPSPDESSIIVIQAAVRTFLAQKELARLKKVVKLQAVIRGHLVRCRAAGTLRCIQAIVKMQTLVRARRANFSVKKSSTKEKGIQDSNTKPHPTYISIEKLLSNKFATQLIESTPRTNIKCDPSKQDPAWDWLERWMSVSSPEILESQPPKPEQDTKNEAVIALAEKPAVEAEPPKRPAKRAATEHADSDGRKSVFGSRKASNPSFIAAHSRFEELTSNSKTDSSNHELPAQTVVYESLKVGRTGGSECGTELSVTSMLDSPDPSEPENIIEYNKEIKLSDTELTRSESEHTLLGTELTHSILNLYDGSRQMTNLSPEPSPRNQEQGTPSSHLSNNTNTKTNTKARRVVVPGEKPKSWSNSTKSPGLRGSLDNLPRESKPSKRRNSFGSQTSEIDHQEGRDGSSNSIPSYMQVTESARAKALNSSPDLQGKEAYMKKRHSMPGALNGRHGSPRLKRSSPQSNPTAKGTDNRERKWQN